MIHSMLLFCVVVVLICVIPGDARATAPIACHALHTDDVADIPVSDPSIQVRCYQPPKICVDVSLAQMMPPCVLETQQGMMATTVPCAMLPFGLDGLTGMVNTNVAPSVEANGMDLPIHGMSIKQLL